MRMKNTGKQTLQRKAKPCSNLGLEEKRLKTDDEECEQCRPGSDAGWGAMPAGEQGPGLGLQLSSLPR